MTGFLFNLISRSSARIPAIQPRLASLFEPQRGAIRQLIVSPSFARGDTWSTSAGVDEDRSDNPPVDSRQGDEDPGCGAHPPMENSMTISMPHEIVVHTNGKHLAATHDPRQTMTPEPAGAENGREQGTSTMFPPPVRLAAPHKMQTAPPISQVSQRREQPGLPQREPRPTKVGGLAEALDDHSSHRLVRSPKLEPQDAAAQDQELVGRSSVSFYEATSPVPRVPLAPESVVWNARATDTQLNFRSAQNVLEIAKPEPTPEPVVHVSIDRIEVRAIAPAAPIARSERSAQPVMGLKEYLRRRACGRSIREEVS